MEVQKKEKTALLPQSQKALPMIHITSPSDLLKAKPIAVMVREHGKETVMETVKMAISKCAFQIDVDLAPSQVETMADDLLDKYQLDSVEDILECLKKGRRGNYGTSYNKLNMIVISEWMSFHLEEKAREREKMISSRKDTKENEITFNQEYSRRMDQHLRHKNNEKVLEAIKEADELINKHVDFELIKTINQVRKSFNDYINDGEIKTEAASLILKVLRDAGIIQGKITDENEAIKRVFDSLIEAGMDINDVIK